MGTRASRTTRAAPIATPALTASRSSRGRARRRSGARPSARKRTASTNTTAAPASASNRLTRRRGGPALALDRRDGCAASTPRRLRRPRLPRRLRRRAGCTDGTVAGLARYGPLGVILGRFFTVVRVVAWPMLARNGLGWTRFTALDAVGALVWSAIWVGLGWF